MGFLSNLFRMQLRKPVDAHSAPSLASSSPPSAPPAPSVAVVDIVLRVLEATDPKGWSLLLAPPMQRHLINQPRRIAAFLANICHESGGLRTLRENLNYTPEALLRLFGEDPRRDGLPPRITRAQAIAYGRIDIKNRALYPNMPLHPADQRAIASLIYGGAWGLKYLGNRPGTDDAVTYIGAGPPQLTGYANHKRFADTLGLQVSAMPALLMQPGPGAEAAAHFWAAAGCNPLADDGDVAGVRRRFNGGVNGLAEVETLYRRAVAVLIEPSSNA